MTTRINSNGPATNVSVSETAVRVTPRPATPFKSMLNASASAVVEGAQSAVRRLPGGEVLAAAVRPTAGAYPGAGGAGPRTAGTGSATDPTAGNGANTAEAGAGSIENALAQHTEDTMYYLNLQQRIQDENRYFSTISNTLKARHDTVKNCISNLR